MKVCLVSAPITTEFGDLEELNSRAVRRTAAEPQLGVLSLAAVLESRGDAVRLFDLDRAYADYVRSVSGSNSEDFAGCAAQLISALDADVYGFSSICSSYPLTIRIATRLKELLPLAPILLGGPQASVVDRQTLAAFPAVDFVLRGEAEQTLPWLLDELQGEARLDRVPGLTYRSPSGTQRNAPAPILANLDSLPFPAYHLTDLLHHADGASLELGRGCPFACTFCSTNDFFRRNFRLRTPERVIADMRTIAAKYGIRSFALVHDMFTVDRRKVAGFCDAMIASGEGFQWSCSARTDCVDEQLLALMASAGCRGIFYGIEAGSVRMQKIIDKHLDPARAEEVIDLTEQLGMRTTVSLITGFPEETWDDVRDTMRMFMHSTRCVQSTPQLNILAPLSETPLYTKHKDQLTLDELCSDMSHQGRIQRDADLALIRQYPDIFPNFYLLPTPHLERECLLELREFFLVSVARFRWLLSALDQYSGGVVDVFFSWRDQRLRLRGSLNGPELRQYYRKHQFRDDLISFVQTSEEGKNAVVKALLEYEDEMLRKAGARHRRAPQLHPASASRALRQTDVPITTDSGTILELSFDIQSVIEGLKRLAEPKWVRRPHFYLTEKASEGVERLVGVSEWIARVLRACDGQRNVAEVVRYLFPSFSEIDESMRGYTITRLLQGARAQGYLAIHEKTKTPAVKAADRSNRSKRRTRPGSSKPKSTSAGAA